MWNRWLVAVDRWRVAHVLLALMVGLSLGAGAARSEDPPRPNAVLKAAPEVQVLLNQGFQANLAGKNAQAGVLYDQALSKARELMDRKGEGDALRGRGVVYSQTGQPQKALEYEQQALPIYHAIGDKSGEASVLFNIGIDYRDTGQPYKALEYYQQALTIYRATKIPWSVGGILNNIGIVYTETGQPQKALQAYQEALTIARTYANTNAEGGTLVNIGVVYFDTSQPEKALAYYQQALPLLRTAGQQQFEAAALRNIGNVYYKTNQPQQALKCYQQALAIVRTLKSKADEGNTLVNIGLVYFDTGQPRKALEYYQQALTIVHALEDKAGEGRALNNIGDIYYKTGQPQRALEYYLQALPLQASVDKQDEGSTLVNIGLVYMDSSQPQRALEYYLQALPILQASEDKYEQANVLNNMGDVESGWHNLYTAALYYDQSLTLSELFRANLGGHSEAKSRYLQSQLSHYYNALRVHLQLHDDERAFALAQQTKARNLLDLMASGRVDLSHDLTEDERQQVQQLRQQADFLNQQMVKEGVENAVGAKLRFADLQRQLQQTEGQLQALTDTLYARHPALTVKNVAKTASLADMAALLPADTALLEYVVTSAQEVTLFVVRQQAGKPSVYVCSLPLPYNDLVKQTVAFHAACADPRRHYRSGARQLYTHLMAPTEKALSGITRLVICPDQTLWDVPFAALLAPDGKFLADRYEISYAYSATGLRAAQALRSASGRPQPTASLLVLANPEFGEVGRFGDLKDLPGQRPFDAPSRPFDAPSRPFDAPSRPFDAPSRALPTLVRGKRIAALPGTQAEADALRQLFPDAVVYTGAQAQEAIVKSEASKYRYLHFATHGFCNDTDPMLSSIVLAVPPQGSKDDGFLTARELSELNLSAELVVLSACNTARGEERSGEGVIGLSWALLVAGVPTQIVSQWSVDDASTATLMADFYRNLKAGHGKASALREAGQNLRHDSKHGHPYYWAPFILLGDGR